MATFSFLKKWGITLLLSALFFGCSTEESLPISEDKLVQVLTDVHIAEAALAEMPVTAKDSAAKIYYQTIFDIHGVGQAEFDTSLLRLMRDPEHFKEVYQRVVEAVAAKRSNQSGGTVRDDEE